MEKIESTDTEIVRYKRNRFTANFSAKNFYSQGHYWFGHIGGEIYRVGLTKFAARMLGELVEFGFEVKSGKQIFVGDIIGWMEGFKAASDIFSLVDGEFIRENPELVENPEIMHAKPHDKGWLYEIKLENSELSKLLSVKDYCTYLDNLIDKMTGEKN